MIYVLGEGESDDWTVVAVWDGPSNFNHRLAEQRAIAEYKRLTKGLRRKEDLLKALDGYDPERILDQSCRLQAFVRSYLFKHYKFSDLEYQVLYL